MRPKDMKEWLVGPLTAMATPFTEDYELDFEALRAHVRFQVDHGMIWGDGALLVAAGAGEDSVMSVQERKALMDVAVEAADGEVPVLAGINHPDIREIADLARHAEKAGIAAVQLAPVYHYEIAEGDIFRLYERISQESDVSIMVYHTWWTGGHFSESLLQDLKDLPTVRAIKWSSNDEVLYRKGIVALRDDLAICDNQGNQILNHMLGGRSFVNHVGNFWPEYVVGIWRLLQQEDYPGVLEKNSRLDWQWDDWEAKVMQETGGHGSYLKAAMEAVGLQAGPPRPPSVRPSAKLLAELRELLERCGVPPAG
jgi:dihydrodipicolinate synthase/N-acetylneuraminate lyase